MYLVRLCVILIFVRKCTEHMLGSMQTFSTAVAGGAHELKPLNCLPNNRAAYSDECTAACVSAGLSGMQMNNGQIGGKRVVAPRVTGAGVTSKQPSRLPPRAVSVEDVDVAAQKDAVAEFPLRSPTERCDCVFDAPCSSHPGILIVVDHFAYLNAGFDPRTSYRHVLSTSRHARLTSHETQTFNTQTGKAICRYCLLLCPTPRLRLRQVD